LSLIPNLSSFSTALQVYLGEPPEVNSGITHILAAFLGRRTLWRLGRSLYLKARGDSSNNMKSNGEEMNQRHLISQFRRNVDNLVVFDVGANVGDWTWFLLEEWSKQNINDRLEIHVFEPIPSTFETLQHRINQHKLHNLVSFEQVALSDDEGVVEMFIVGENAGTNSQYRVVTDQNSPSISVRRTTVYAYCLKHNIDTVHFLKCDTEGHDMEVLYGTRKLIEEQRIMVCQFEYNHLWVYSRRFLKDVFDYAENTPYSIGKVTPHGIEIYPKWHPELERFFEGNYVLLHRDALGWFPIKNGSFDIYNTYNFA
jgi:FkbM family methyltransferase